MFTMIVSLYVFQIDRPRYKYKPSNLSTYKYPGIERSLFNRVLLNQQKLEPVGKLFYIIFLKLFT